MIDNQLYMKKDGAYRCHFFYCLTKPEKNSWLLVLYFPTGSGYEISASEGKYLSFRQVRLIYGNIKCLYIRCMNDAMHEKAGYRIYNRIK